MTWTCAECGGDSLVTETRKASGMLKRYRQCKACGHRWTTFEVTADKLNRKPQMAAKVKTEPGLRRRALWLLRRGFDVPPSKQEIYKAHMDAGATTEEMKSLLGLE